MSKKLNLKNLRLIVAEVLHNTRGVPKNLKGSDKFELLGVAYGPAAVEEDFRKWCQENVQNAPRYPITDYLRVVDERLGGETKVLEKPFLQDPRIQVLSAAAYEITATTPPRKAVAELLTQYSEVEILEALKEYSDTLDDKDYKKNIRAFFVDGGCGAVIYARRKRLEK